MFDIDIDIDFKLYMNYLITLMTAVHQSSSIGH